jgi:hypothetical protein
VNSAVAGFLAIGITLAGFLALGGRWLPTYLLVASTVALVLLLAPDSYLAFGLILLALAVGVPLPATTTCQSCFRARPNFAARLSRPWSEAASKRIPMCAEHAIPGRVVPEITRTSRPRNNHMSKKRLSRAGRMCGA